MSMNLLQIPHKDNEQQGQFTMENMPLEDKKRIVSTISAVQKAAGEAVFPIENSCHLISKMGAEILKQHYDIPAYILSGDANYILKSPDGDIAIFFKGDNPYKGIGNGHSIVVVDDHNTANSPPWIIGFQSPFLNKIADSFPFKPGLLWGRAGSDAVLEFSFGQSHTSADHLKKQYSRPRVADLVSVAVDWYVRPPKRMRDKLLADICDNKPETNRVKRLKYAPLKIEDNLRTPISRYPRHQLGGNK
jgi:hypothetical protein